jgi:hypothetical protein
MARQHVYMLVIIVVVCVGLAAYLVIPRSASAAVKALRGYQPGATGSFSYQGGGIRTAYIET